MDDILYGALLGLIQGLTEFLPVSSSGHLAVAQALMPGFNEPALLYDTMLHLATIFAVLVYFRKRIAAMLMALAGIFTQRYRMQTHNEKPIIVGIIVATIPTAVIGFALKDRVEFLLDKPAIIGYLLLVTSVMLFLSDRFKGKSGVGVASSLFIGIMQGIAVVPGISRSGATIFAGLLSGLSRKAAAEFSFLLSIPAVIGAAILQIPDIGAINLSAMPVYIIGMVVAFLTGLFAIYIVMKMVQKAKLYVFAMYCLIVGIAVIILV